MGRVFGLGGDCRIRGVVFLRSTLVAAHRANAGCAPVGDVRAAHKRIAGHRRQCARLFRRRLDRLSQCGDREVLTSRATSAISSSAWSASAAPAVRFSRKLSPGWWADKPPMPQSSARYATTNYASSTRNFRWWTSAVLFAQKVQAQGRVLVSGAGRLHQQQTKLCRFQRLPKSAGRIGNQ